MISVVILTKNEQETIADCVKSVAWADEIIIVDDFSEDKTVRVLEHLENKKMAIYKRHLANDFSGQRNFGLEKAKHEWVLFLDADERVSSSLQFEILGVINASIDGMHGFKIHRKDFMWGRELRYGETGSVHLLRLGKKGFGTWTGNVHETWQIKGKIGQLKTPLLHYPHTNVTEFLSEINFYTDLRANELFRNHVQVPQWAIVLYPLGKFIQNYFI
jgi:glycosyltransferase involved in cell wall biosynthesis